MKRPVVSIVMGSDSDLDTMQEAMKVLKENSIPFEVRVLSAHRSPEAVLAFSRGTQKRGIKVIITGAGGAAHLAGVIASHTTLPVIGVPIHTKVFKGVDSLLSIIQMPGGVPVATMAIGKSGAKNAGLLTMQILAIEDRNLQTKLKRLKKSLASATLKKDKKLRNGFNPST